MIFFFFQHMILNCVHLRPSLSGCKVTSLLPTAPLLFFTTMLLLHLPNGLALLLLLCEAQCGFPAAQRRWRRRRSGGAYSFLNEVLNSSSGLFDLILLKTLCGRDYFYSYFTDEEMLLKFWFFCPSVDSDFLEEAYRKRQ